MAADNMQKTKHLKLYELLRKETDEQHPISRVQLCRWLNEMGISSKSGHSAWTSGGQRKMVKRILS